MLVVLFRIFFDQKEGKLLRDIIRKNPWATTSVLITVVDASLIFVLVLYLKAGHLGMEPQRSRAESIVGIWGGLSVLFSFLTALLGVAMDRSKMLAVLALLLSALSILFYLQ